MLKERRVWLGADPCLTSKCTAEAMLGGALTGFLEGWDHHFRWV
jgi:hypothetical protein